MVFQIVYALEASDYPFIDEKSPTVLTYLHYMMKMEPHNAGSEIQFSFVPSRFSSYQEFLKDIAWRNGLKIYGEQDMIAEKYDLNQIVAVPIFYILSPNMDMPTNYEVPKD